MIRRTDRTRGLVALALLVVLALAAASCAAPTPAAAPATTGGAVRPEPALAAARVASADLPAPIGRTVSVVGEGAVPVEPDVAYVTVGVETRHAAARDAQAANNAVVAAVLAAVRSAGVAEADLRTSGVSLHPFYDREPGQVAAYMAGNSVRVTVRDVARAGAVLDAAIAAGANQAGSVQFGRLDDREARQQALDQAVRAARAKAETIAGAGGLRVLGTHSLQEVFGGPATPEGAAGAAEAAALGKGDLPVEPGRLFVRARVQATYEVEP
jgi:uncharacterized protein YggE